MVMEVETNLNTSKIYINKGNLAITIVFDHNENENVEFSEMIIVVKDIHGIKFSSHMVEWSVENVGEDDKPIKIRANGGNEHDDIVIDDECNLIAKAFNLLGYQYVERDM